MRKSTLYALTSLALLLTVPWWFGEDSDARIVGMPSWAFYALLASAAYAAVVAFCLGKFWEVSAGTEETDDEDGEDGER